MNEAKKEIVISKEDAVFWIDGRGRWQNQHGPFEHAKIIDYFHSAIRRDEQGYYLFQERDEHGEKVYFKYEDTPLFVFDVLFEENILLVLNTKKQIKLRPEDLTVKGDSLYMNDGEELIKFAERGLLKISDIIEEIDDQLYIRVDDKPYEIRGVANGFEGKFLEYLSKCTRPAISNG